MDEQIRRYLRVLNAYPKPYWRSAENADCEDVVKSELEPVEFIAERLVSQVLRIAGIPNQPALWSHHSRWLRSFLDIERCDWRFFDFTELEGCAWYDIEIIVCEAGKEFVSHLLLVPAFSSYLFKYVKGIFTEYKDTAIFKAVLETDEDFVDLSSGKPTLSNVLIAIGIYCLAEENYTKKEKEIHRLLSQLFNRGKKAYDAILAEFIFEQAWATSCSVGSILKCTALQYLVTALNDCIPVAEDTYKEEFNDAYSDICFGNYIYIPPLRNTERKARKVLQEILKSFDEERDVVVERLKTGECFVFFNRDYPVFDCWGVRYKEKEEMSLSMYACRNLLDFRLLSLFCIFLIYFKKEKGGVSCEKECA